MTYDDPKIYNDPNFPQRETRNDNEIGGTSWGLVAGSVAILALIFGLAFYFNSDGDGGASIATSKNPAGMSAPATTGSGTAR